MKRIIFTTLLVFLISNVVWAGTIRDLEARYSRGMGLIQNGQYNEAAGYFEVLVADYPTIPKARLGLAQAYARGGKVGLARQEFQRVLNSDPPDELEKNIKKVMKDLGVSSRTNFEVSLGFMSDGNVTGGGSGLPNIGGLQFKLNEEAKQQSDSALLYSASMVHLSPFGEGSALWETSLSFNSADCVEWRKFSIQTIQFSSGPSWSVGDFRLSLPVVGDYYFLGSDRYEGGVGMTPTFGRLLGKKSYLQGFFSYSRRQNYYVEGRTGDQIGTGLSVRRALTKKMVANVGYQFWKSDVALETLSNDTHVLYYGLSRSLTDSLSARVSQAFSWSGYDAGLGMFGGLPREDSRVTTSLGLRKNLGKKKGEVSVEYRTTDDRSSVDLYDYGRDQFIVRWSKKF